MCERFFVLSTDTVMSRIIFQDTREDECQAYAEYHWLDVAGPDEMVAVACEHDKQVIAALHVASC